MKRLDQCRTKKLTLLQAGAGYGKTSALRQWASLLSKEGNIVPWLTVDRDDNTLPQFLFHLTLALNAAHGDIGVHAIAIIQSAPAAPARTIISSLISDIASVAHDVYLIIEDYHGLSDPGIHEMMAYLLDYAPINMRIIISSRRATRLPVIKTLSKNQASIIDASTLAFDSTEIDAFLSKEKIIHLTIDDLRSLRGKIGGWPALLRVIVATSQLGDRGKLKITERALNEPWAIAEFFSDVLAEMPEDLTRFMMRISLLRRFSLPLCMAVAEGSPYGISHFSSIIDSHFLLIPLDATGSWFCFHPLLQEYLGHRLAQQAQQEVQELHARAARWLASHGFWKEAIDHSISAGDIASSSEWIQDRAMALVKSGNLVALSHWHHVYRHALTKSAVAVKASIAWGLASEATFVESLALLNEIESDLHASHDSDSVAVKLSCDILRSLAYVHSSDLLNAMPLASRGQRESGDAWLSNVASNVLRLCHWRQGQLQSFYEVPWTPFPPGAERANMAVTGYRLCIQAIVEFEQLNLDLSKRYLKEALALGSRCSEGDPLFAAFAMPLVALHHYEKGDFDAAEDLLGSKLHFIDAVGLNEGLLHAYVVLARIASHRGNLSLAHSLVDQLEQLSGNRQWQRLSVNLLLERLRLFSMEGRSMELNATLKRLNSLLSQLAHSPNGVEKDVLIRAGLTQTMYKARLPEACMIARLLELQRDARQAMHPRLALCIEFALSSRLWEAGRQTEAEAVFLQAFTKAADCGLHQTVIDYCPSAGSLASRLLKYAATRQLSREHIGFADGLVASKVLSPKGQTAKADNGAHSPLTSREMEILQLIGLGQSNKEIARSLNIASETVKSHVKKLFIKLEVESRPQAIQRAGSLGILKY